MLRTLLAALLICFASPALAQTQGNAVGDLVSKCGANVPIFGTGSAGTNAPLSCSGTAQASQGGTGVASPTANDIYKGAGSSPMVPSALADDGTKVSSSEPVDLTNGALVTEIPNAGTTGTTLNKLAKLTGAPSTVVILTTADTTGVAGVVVGGAGTTGNALVARQGQASCVFDGATTAGDYVQASTSIAGDCTDATATYPTTGQILGRVLSTNGSGGTYTLTLFSPEIRGGSGGGGGGTVSTTGSPVSGNLTKFSAATTITNGDLSGDCTTSGTLAVTCTKTSGTAFSALATTAPGTGVGTALGNNLSAAGGVTSTIASGTAALGTGAISSATCATVVTVTATNVATTDVVLASFNGDPTAVTGYIPSTSGMLTIVGYPTAGNVNFKVCNNTSGSITPGAITLNWRVVR